MTRVLLTFGSKFLTGHILNILLARGHSVVTVVKSPRRARWIEKAHPKVSKEKLRTILVEKLADPDAFHEAFSSDPPFEAVIHTSSMIRANSGENNVKKDKKKDKKIHGFDPTLLGSTGILEAIKKNAPAVKKVVITSSMSAVVPLTGSIVGKKYSGADWNPVPKPTPLEDGEVDEWLSSHITHAERAAWDFVEKEKPDFTLTSCIGPDALFGPSAYPPAVHAGHLVPRDKALDKALPLAIRLVHQFITGAATQSCPPPLRSCFFVDVRDFALSHVLAAEKEEAAGERFVIVADKFCNKQMAEVISENFPDLSYRLPTGEQLKSGDFPAGGTPDFDNRRSVEVLGMKYRSFTESIVDTAKALQARRVKNRVDGMDGEISTRV